MPETAPAAPATPARAEPAPIPTTAELLKEVAAGSAARPTPSAAPSTSPLASPAADAPTSSPPPSDSKDGSPSDPAKEPPKPAETEDTRLARLAGEQKRVDRDRKVLKTERETWRTEQAETVRAAEALRSIKGARTKAEKVAALRSLEADIDGPDGWYWALHEHVLANPAKEPTPEELVEAKVERKLDERKKADEAAAVEAEAKAQAEKVKKVQEAEQFFGDSAAKSLKAEPAKWPALVRFGVSYGDIHSFVRDQYRTAGKAPSDAEILDHFEKIAQAKIEEIRPGKVGDTPVKATTTVNGSWTRDAPSGSDREMSLEEITRQAKIEAGILK